MKSQRLFVTLLLGLGATLALAWLLAGAPLPTARAADINSVDTNTDGVSAGDGHCTLREAINNANSDSDTTGSDCTAGSGADTIALGSDTYVLTRTGTGEDGNDTGDLDVTGPLTVTGDGPYSTTIDATGLISDRVFDLRPNAGTVVISGVTIINGNVAWDGGGIYNNDADLALINTIVGSNVASATFPFGRGGGVCVLNGSLTLDGGQLLSNTASRDGGGVYVAAASTLTQAGVSTIAHNDAGSSGGGVYLHQGSATLGEAQVFANTAAWGGGIYVYQGQATLTGGEVLSNHAAHGGGVYVSEGSATLNGGQILSNSASFDGGGVYVEKGSATLNVSGGQVLSNTANSNGGGVCVWQGSAVLNGGQVISNSAGNHGGGVYVYEGSATLSGGQVLSNSADFGGGIYTRRITATFTQTGSSVIGYNIAANGGGGLCVYGGSATLNGGQIVSNTAGYGGGIYNNNATLTIVNTTISRNRATTSFGGGLFANGGTTVLTYTTVASNTAVMAGGGVRRPGGTVIVKDTIVAYNDPDNCSSFLTSNGHNLEYGDQCGLSNTGDLTATDPLLGPLTCESGALVHPLLDGSPAIDGGACITGITTDQRGVTRPKGATCDIGAYEWEWPRIYLPLVLRNYP
jgi:CSLREA domain-containing protein